MQKPNKRPNRQVVDRNEVIDKLRLAHEVAVKNTQELIEKNENKKI